MRNRIVHALLFLLCVGWNAIAQDVAMLNLDEEVDGDIDVSGNIDHWQFEVGENGATVFRDRTAKSGGSLYFRLRAPNGSQIYNTLAADTGPTLLEDAGTYTMEVYGLGNDTATYSFILWSVPDPEVTVMNLDTEVDGEIETPGVQDHWQFTVAENTTIFRDRVAKSGGGLYFRLLAPDGSQIYNTLAADTGPTLLEDAGTYTMEVYGLGDDTATYSFVLWNVPDPDVTVINLDNQVNGEIETPGVQDHWQFTVAANTTIFRDRTAKSGGAIYFRLLAPDGSQIYNTLSTDTGPTLLEAAGTYTLEVYGLGDDTATYSVVLWTVQQADVTELNLDTEVDGEIETPGVQDRWEFTVAANATIFRDRTAKSGGAIYFQLLAPDGSQIYNTLSTDTGPTLLEAAGTYTMVVYGLGDDTATYSFIVWNVPAPDVTALAHDTLVNGEIETPGVRDHWEFDVTANTIIYQDRQATAGGALYFRLLAPDDTQIYNTLSMDKGPTVLAEAGTYTMEVYGIGDDTATYSFRIDVLPTSTVAPLPAVSDNRDFVVSWTGDDQTDGSGVAAYDIYVSTDDGPFEIWRPQTVAVNAVFNGELSTKYDFYSIAYDVAGNVEEKVEASEATTTTVDIDDGPLDWQSGSWGIKVTPYGSPNSAHITINWPDGGSKVGNALEVYYTFENNSTPQLWVFLTDGFWRQTAVGNSFATSYRLFRYISSDDEVQDNPLGDAFEVVEVTADGTLSLRLDYRNDAAGGDTFSIETELLLDPPDAQQTSMTATMTVTNETGANVVPDGVNGQKYRDLSRQWVFFGISSMYVADDFMAGVPQWVTGLDPEGDFIGTIDDDDPLNDGRSVSAGIDVSTHDTADIRIGQTLFSLNHDANVLPNTVIPDQDVHNIVSLKQVASRLSTHHKYDPGRDHRVVLLDAAGLTDDLEQLKWTTAYVRDDANLVDGDNIQIGLGLDDLVGTWPDGASQTVSMWLATGTPTATVALKQDWNLVSLPVESREVAEDLLFDFDSGGPAYDAIVGWSAEQQRFTFVKDTAVLKAVAGYWISSPLLEWLSPQITARLASGIVALRVGWNLVGTISETPKPDSAAIHGIIWWWDAEIQVYKVVQAGEKLIPGRAYWVYAFEDTSIELGR